MRRLLLLAACLLAAAGPAAALETVTLQLNWKHQFQFAGYYAAIDRGYYREAGLDVHLVEVHEGMDPMNAVIQGQAQFGVGASELVLRRGRGDPVVALATILQHSPLLLLTGSQIDSIHDLAGKRVMLLAHETELNAYLARERVPPAGLQVIAPSYNPRDLIEGRVDAMSAYQTDEPYLLRQAGFHFKSFSPRSAGVDFYGDTLFTTEAMIHDHPELVRAFREASLRGWRYAMANQPEIVDLILANYGRRHNREHLLFEAGEMERLMQPELVEIGHMSRGRWQHVADTYAELGMLPTGSTLDGFMYDEAGPAVLPPWIKPAFLAAGILLTLLTLVIVRIRRLNRRLGSESEARRSLLQELRATQRDLAALIDATPGAAMLLDRDGAVLAMNTAGTRRFQMSKADIMGRSIFDLFPPEIRDRRRQATLRAMEERRQTTIEDQRAGRNLRNTIVPVVDDDGQVRRVAVFSEDITEARAAEEALRAGEERYRLLLETAPFPVIITRISDSTVVYINHRAALRFGVPQDEAVGRQAPDFWQAPTDRSRMVQDLRRDGLVTDWEVGLKTATGEPFWVYLSAVLVYQSDEAQAFVSFADITERRQAHHQLQSQLEEIRELQAKLAEMAIRDGLTGLYNRRYLDETLEREIARSRREGHPLSLVMIDIDRFKEINDTYGHQAGDEVLRTLADQLHRQVRAEDVPCRYGGEEFLILLPGMPLQSATERAEAWRQEFADKQVRFGDFELRNTASFGVASYPGHGKTADELSRCADQALYQAKAGGRNRVVAFAATDTDT